MEIIREKLTPKQARLERLSTRNYFMIEAVKKYPDYRCDTRDQTFYMVLNSVDGQKLSHLILAEESTNRLHDDDLGWLEQTGVVICSSTDCDDTAVPMLYADQPSGIRAWKELHDVSGVKMSADDEDSLDDRLELLGEDEDDEDDED
jgi:hypothetical protein